MKTVVQALLFFAMSFQLAAQTAPDIEIYVRLDGKGDFTSIQEAIMSVRAFTEHTSTIHISEGVYNEKVQIPTYLNNIVLEGAGADRTIISYNDYSGRIVDGVKLSTFTSYTLHVQGDQIELKNLTVENTSCGQGQAVALHVDGDEFLAENVRLLGCQDTLYTGGPNSRHYIKDSYIEGTTDFIFGPSTVLFENCTINSKKNSYVTAASTPKGVLFGYVFKNCHFTASEGITEVYLGRPWRPYAKTVIIDCILDEHILAFGWNPWKGDKLFPNKEKTTFYAEYNSQGPGANPKERVDWSFQLSEREASYYTIDQILDYKHWVKNN
ncbi:MAG: pectin esterase [Flavobacteriaceae bacterium]|jgi:pectinesterase|nr:pectin esterase [Flavobacteriaceae bacterium]